MQSCLFPWNFQFVLHRFCLDEKWFYFESRRNEENNLPIASFEDIDEWYMPDPTTRSRHHVTKPMLMCIVAHPSPPLVYWICQTRNGWKHCNIVMIRVRKDKVVQRSSRAHDFFPIVSLTSWKWWRLATVMFKRFWWDHNWRVYWNSRYLLQHSRGCQMQILFQLWNVV